MATELRDQGFEVTWVQVYQSPYHTEKKDFYFDDWAWQVGPADPNSPLVKATKDYVTNVIRPNTQSTTLQVLTSDGPIELADDTRARCLRKFFKDSWKDLNQFMDVIQSARKENPRKRYQILEAHTQNIFKMPLGKRWILEWMGALSTSRAVDARTWMTKWDGQFIDPRQDYWLLEDGLGDVIERGIQWAEKKGVKIKRKASVVDIGSQGSLATGVELVGAEGFLKCRYLVVCHSLETLGKVASKFSTKFKDPVKPGAEKLVWVRCGFKMKAHSKPAGLESFSSFVVDPYMPLVADNMGLIKWKVSEDGDSLTVWVRIPHGELKRRGYMVELTEKILNKMRELFPRFSDELVAVRPFEEYFGSSDVGRDDVAMVYDDTTGFSGSRSRIRNMWLCGPERDRNLSLLGGLFTESKIFEELKLIRNKELRRDRKIQPPPDGESVVSK